MDKTTAIALLGGSVREAASRLDLSTQAVHKWPEKGSMPRPVCDRVLAHLVREACRHDSGMRLHLKLPADALTMPAEHGPANGTSLDEAAAI